MRTILVIVNDHNTRVAMRQVLEGAGHFVFSAADGIDGLATLSRIKRPDCILLDLDLPLMNGKQFLELKASQREYSSVPVILLTAPDEISVQGVRKIIAKPFEKDQLLRVVHELFESELPG